MVVERANTVGSSGEAGRRTRWRYRITFTFLRQWRLIKPRRLVRMDTDVLDVDTARHHYKKALELGGTPDKDLDFLLK